MFLIEYAKGQFVNGETIQWVSVRCKKVVFGVVGEPEGEWNVDIDFTDAFLNHLQALNDNISSVQSRYKEINT
jgi:hypothetical protein